MRMLCALFIAAFCTACPKVSENPQVETATAAPSPEWWMSVKDGMVYQGLYYPPVGLYVAGTREGGVFVPSGDIEGDGAFLGQSGDPMYLDMRTGKISKHQPPLPYVQGNLTPLGFSPASRRVFY